MIGRYLQHAAGWRRADQADKFQLQRQPVGNDRIDDGCRAVAIDVVGSQGEVDGRTGRGNGWGGGLARAHRWCAVLDTRIGAAYSWRSRAAGEIDVSAVLDSRRHDHRRAAAHVIANLWRGGEGKIARSRRSIGTQVGELPAHAGCGGGNVRRHAVGDRCTRAGDVCGQRNICREIAVGSGDQRQRGVLDGGAHVAADVAIGGRTPATAADRGECDTGRQRTQCLRQALDHGEVRHARIGIVGIGGDAIDDRVAGAGRHVVGTLVRGTGWRWRANRVIANSWTDVFRGTEHGRDACTGRVVDGRAVRKSCRIAHNQRALGACGTGVQTLQARWRRRCVIQVPGDRDWRPSRDTAAIAVLDAGCGQTRHVRQGIYQGRVGDRHVAGGRSRANTHAIRHCLASGDRQCGGRVDTLLGDLVCRLRSIN